jgi:REP element-mobilizing transposase RayT
MPTHKSIPFFDGVYFITFTCCKWLPLISATDGFDIVYKWFEILKKNSNYIIGYVIMPNHIHVMIGFKNNRVSLNNIVGNGKRFMAYEIIDRLVKSDEKIFLNVLANAVSNSGKKSGKKHLVWQKSFDWKECKSEKFINQKLDYMHNNPCQGKWKFYD